MKRQFGEHLFEMKFLDSKDIKSESANRNSRNEALVRAVICAGLYPNVAEVRTFQVICAGLYPNVAEVGTFQAIPAVLLFSMSNQWLTNDVKNYNVEGTSSIRETKS